ncbi:ABC transporter permease subunit [Microbacterium sp. SYP-A9085]|uniref:ABC transporter permease n=1 Tax=Microbacterium sp. SYP-A9085 TaxID=2664454 RepID=UPI0013244A63|nr:ABC transporter permease subunit [Microbacterium sp. SYP-A9085]
MTVYIVRRIVNYLILTAVASSLAYVLASIGLNPVWQFENRHPRPPQSSIDQLLDAWGVNPKIPLIERTWTWFINMFHGDLGLTVGNQPVIEQIGVRAGVSLQLLLVGSILGAILGVVLGVWGAVRQYKASDQVVTLVSYIVFATPTFVMGILLMILATDLNNVLGTQLITFSGQYSPNAAPDFWSQFWDRISHALLPTLVLVLLGAASYSRYQRNAMLDVLGADYIRTARSKGRTRGSALVRHGVRIALIPMSTFFAYSFGTLVAGSAMLEIVFSWHGMGEMTIQSVQQNDINSLAGSTLFIAILILCSSTLSEILYAALDPRVRR